MMKKGCVGMCCSEAFPKHSLGDHWSSSYLFSFSEQVYLFACTRVVIDLALIVNSPSYFSTTLFWKAKAAFRGNPTTLA